MPRKLNLAGVFPQSHLVGRFIPRRFLVVTLGRGLGSDQILKMHQDAETQQEKESR